MVQEPGRFEADLARARAGERDALSAVLEACQPRIQRMVELRLSPTLRRRVDATDVVQEVLLEAARRFDEWRRDDRFPFHVWLRLLAAQTIAQAHRRHLGAQKRDAQRELALGGERPSVSAVSLANLLVASETSPTQAARREELRAHVTAALAELDEADREILALRHFEELSNEDAAAELGIEPAAASKRFVRALRRLQLVLRALASGSHGGAP